MLTVKWSDLGRPTERSEIDVPGIGKVEVTERDVKRAEERGDDPVFELLPHKRQPLSGQQPKYFNLGGIVDSTEPNVP